MGRTCEICLLETARPESSCWWAQEERWRKEGPCLYRLLAVRQQHGDGVLAPEAVPQGPRGCARCALVAHEDHHARRRHVLPLPVPQNQPGALGCLFFPYVLPCGGSNVRKEPSINNSAVCAQCSVVCMHELLASEPLVQALTQVSRCLAGAAWEVSKAGQGRAGECAHWRRSMRSCRHMAMSFSGSSTTM